MAKGELVPLFQCGVPNEKGDIVRDSGLSVDIPTVNELYEKIYGKLRSGITFEAYKVLVVAKT